MVRRNFASYPRIILVRGGRVRHPDDPPAGGQDLPLSDDKTDSELNSE